MKKTLTILCLLIAFSVFSQKIITTTNLSLQAMKEGGAVLNFGVGLGSVAPSADVTVSFASQNGYFTAPGSLTFTVSNFSTPQGVNLSASNNGNPDGLRYDYLVINATGGGYSTSQKIKLQIVDAYIDSSFVRGWPNYSTHLTNTASVATLRASLISEVFNGSGIPVNAVPDSVTIGYTGTMHQTITGALTGCSADKIVFNETDNQGYVWSSKIYHIQKTGGTHSEIMIVHGGHGSETGHKEMIQDLINNDVDVIYAVMPVVTQNTETNPGITPPGVGAHNDITTSGLDNGTYNPLTLFISDKVRAVNYIVANYSYSSFYVAGCSGGGWTSMLLGAIDTRIIKSFDVRGITPSNFALVALNVDYEQGPVTAITNFELGPGFSSAQLTANYKAINYFDLCLLASSGGRSFYMIHHYDDTCCHKTFVYNLFQPRLSLDAGLFQGVIELYMMTDPLYAVHSFNVPDRAYIISKI